MDDALVLSVAKAIVTEKKEVLILVVMDDALVRAQDGQEDERETVLILVVMDDALVRHKGYGFRQGGKSLNPCCNG